MKGLQSRLDLPMVFHNTLYSFLVAKGLKFTIAQPVCIQACFRECPPWCSIVGDTVTVHTFFNMYFTLACQFSDSVELNLYTSPASTDIAFP